jgi:hypothetical protein
VVRTASPIAPPICWSDCSTPEAQPGVLVGHAVHGAVAERRQDQAAAEGEQHAGRQHLGQEGAVGRDPGEGQRAGRRQQQAGHEDRPQPDAGDDLGGQPEGQPDGDAEGQEGQPCPQRAEAQDQLQVEGRDEELGEEHRGEQQRDGVGGQPGALAQKDSGRSGSRAVRWTGRTAGAAPAAHQRDERRAAVVQSWRRASMTRRRCRQAGRDQQRAADVQPVARGRRLRSTSAARRPAREGERGC